MTQAEAWVRVRRVDATAREIEEHRPEGAGCVVASVVVAAGVAVMLSWNEMPIMASVTAACSVFAGTAYEVGRRRQNAVISDERGSGAVWELESRNAPLYHAHVKWGFEALLVHLGGGKCLVMPFPLGESLTESRFEVVDDSCGQVVEKDTVDLQDIVMLLRERLSIRWFERTRHVASVRIGGVMRYLDSEVPGQCGGLLGQFVPGQVCLVDGFEVHGDPPEPRLSEEAERWEGLDVEHRHQFTSRLPLPRPLGLAQPEMEREGEGTARVRIRGGQFALVYWYGNAMLLVRVAPGRAAVLSDPTAEGFPLQVGGHPARFDYGEAALANDRVTLEFVEESGDLLSYTVSGVRVPIDESHMGPDLGRSGSMPQRALTWFDDLDDRRVGWIDAVLGRMAEPAS